MKVAIVGTGYVGLVAGACLAEIGHDVTCIDVDITKVEAINDGRAPIHELGLPELLTRHVPGSLRATTDLDAAVRQASVTMIAVGTPFDGERIDLSYIREATRQIGEALRGGTAPHVVVVKSTVVPGTTVDVVTPIIATASGRADIAVAMNPEFLREGVAVADFMAPDRIVVGAADELAFAMLEELYAPLNAPDVMHTSATTAELIKYASNGLLATLISFSNDIANLAVELRDVDVVDVMRGVHLDGRISPVIDGKRVTPKVTTYLEAGCGFGGSCFPKDVKALVSHGVLNGVPMPVLDGVLQTNARQPLRVLDLIMRGVADIATARVAVLGIAFKEGTDDIRESASLPVVDALVAAGTDVVVHDPQAGEGARSRWGDSVQVATDIDGAVTDADVVVVMTRWPEYRTLPAVLTRLGSSPLVVDARRLLEPGSVTRYAGIGRRATQPE